MANLLLLLLVSPFAGALILMALASRPRPVELSHALAAEKAQLQQSAWIAGAAGGLSALALLALAADVIAGTPARANWAWLPALGVGFGLRLDGLALLFCGLIVGIGHAGNPGIQSGLEHLAQVGACELLRMACSEFNSLQLSS